MGLNVYDFYQGKYLWEIMGRELGEAGGLSHHDGSLTVCERGQEGWVEVSQTAM